jgi:hypothetical protein
MKMELFTEITIKAPVAEVWKILMETEKYPDWNPFISKIEGTLKEGNQIHVELGGMKFDPILLVKQPNREFRWRGKLWVKGLFDGEHYFLLSENPNGSCHFVQGEMFSGLFVRLFKNNVLVKTKLNFEQMNAALKARAESIIIPAS